ncbi:hypothetical protein PQX77_007102 [Marasmius sp. AFHP31]|nr:hypothetical protein PQX77_007102 [Marasmius sp. AFHP31]
MSPINVVLTYIHSEYPHNADGSSSQMQKFKCEAYRTIFVPLDSTICMACIVYEIKPHTHPALPLLKPSTVATELYHKCVQVVGVVGSTVQSVERSASTPLVLGGKSVAEVHPGLMNRHMKRKVIDQEKTKMFPKGRGSEGVVSCRSVNQFEADGTFKRVEVESAVTIGCIYFNTKTQETYKAIFDGLQRHVKSITGHPLSFHALQEGGNIQAVSIDMELAELLGMGDSFAALNDPEHSGVQAEDACAETTTPLISRVCKTHYDRKEGQRHHKLVEAHTTSNTHQSLQKQYKDVP